MPELQMTLRKTIAAKVEAPPVLLSFSWLEVCDLSPSTNDQRLEVNISLVNFTSKQLIRTAIAHFRAAFGY